jgi:energy-converting hydrogenase Eha subunit H
MLFTSTATALASAGTESVRELPMPPWAFGAVAFGCFVVLLGVLWTFRNTAAKYDKPDPGAHH